MTLTEWQKKFSTVEDCHTFLVKQRWPDGFECPICGHPEAWIIHRQDRQGIELYECKQCRRQTSVTAGTVFHRSKVSLPVWFLAIYLVVIDNRGVPALTLARELGIAYHTARLMHHKIQQTTDKRHGRDFLLGEWIERGMPAISAMDTPLRGVSERRQSADEWTGEAILLTLQQAYRQSGYFSRDRWSREHRSPTVAIIQRKFGSWSTAWNAAGLEKSGRRTTATDVIAVLQATDEYVPEQDWRRRRQFPSATTIRRVFGSYAMAWKAAGIAPSQSTKISEGQERILAEMRAGGRYYTIKEWTQAGMRPSVITIYRYFGSWLAAWRKAGIAVKRTP